MTFWQGVALGIVQGLTEFLPISSSGHLVVTKELFNLSSPGVLVEVALHVATLIAVVFVYRDRLWRLLSGAISGGRDEWYYLMLLAIGTLPAAFVGFFLADWIESVFDSLMVVGIDFLVTGAILWSTRRAPVGDVGERPSTRTAGAIGLAQAVAVLPGISRSGSTIATAMWLGLDPVRAAEYSFLLSIPVVLGAAALQLPNLAADVTAVGAIPLLAGFVTSLAAGIFAIRLLVALLKRGRFHRFAPYCLTIGIATIAWAVTRG